MRVLVCGSRSWTDCSAIINAMKTLPRETVIIEGCARGVDQLAERAAQLLLFEVEHFPAQWEAYGKAAGFMRNDLMLSVGQPDEVWAFWDGVSRGTQHMMKQARKAGVPVRVFTS